MLHFIFKDGCGNLHRIASFSKQIEEQQTQCKNIRVFTLKLKKSIVLLNYCFVKSMKIESNINIINLLVDNSSEFFLVPTISIATSYQACLIVCFLDLWIQCRPSRHFLHKISGRDESYLEEKQMFFTLLFLISSQ